MDIPLHVVAEHQHHGAHQIPEILLMEILYHTGNRNRFRTGAAYQHFSHSIVGRCETKSVDGSAVQYISRRTLRYVDIGSCQYLHAEGLQIVFIDVLRSRSNFNEASITLVKKGRVAQHSVYRWVAYRYGSNLRILFKCPFHPQGLVLV